MVTEKSLIHAHKLKLRWFVALSTLPLLAVVSAFGIIPQSDIDFIFNQKVIQNISLPQDELSKADTGTFWHSERVQRGDTVDELLRRLNVDDATASLYLRNPKNPASLQHLPVGKNIQAETLADGSLVSLRFMNGSGNQVLVEKRKDSFQTRLIPLQTEQRTLVRTGQISSTLFAATDQAGISDAAAVQLADIFSGDIDFHRDLRKGDRFSVIYEMNYINGEPVSTGKILAAEFINQGRSYRALYFESSPGHGNYYSPDGHSMHKAFLRSPLEFSRVSSGFSLSRFHPVLNKWRAHKGVDYAAAVGTKVKSTADGVITFVGQMGGYGNVIMINHQSPYSTVYGHLSRFAAGLRKGQRVQQGDIIGYVGQSGLATGPHLHYEFLISGVHRNPLNVALPDAKPVNPAQKSQFLASTAALNEQLTQLDSKQLAQAN